MLLEIIYLRLVNDRSDIKTITKCTVKDLIQNLENSIASLYNQIIHSKP